MQHVFIRNNEFKVFNIPYEATFGTFNNAFSKRKENSVQIL